MPFIARSFIKKAAVAGAILFVAAQFVRPDRSNPPADPALSILQDGHLDGEIAELIKKSCFDCHSNETRWPWYSAITPMNVLIANDVIDARRRLNFSAWATYKPAKKLGLLELIDDQVSGRQMPLQRYLLLHPRASLSDVEVNALSQWANDEAERVSIHADSRNPR